MKQYHDMLNHILTHGQERKDRTGVGTTGVFGYQMRFDLAEGFPLLTTKKVYLRSIIHELLWFIKGETNIKYLVDNDVHIWDEWPYQKYLKANNLEEKYPMYSTEWKTQQQEFIKNIKNDNNFADKWGDLGPVYGSQWRSWPTANGETIDQLGKLVDNLKNNPYSRRHIVSAWNPAEVDNMALPPCHTLFQFYVSPDNRLSVQLYQRSADSFLGVPFNIASYALLLMMVAQVTGYEPGEFIHTFGDLHIYLNHQEQVKTQLSREFRTSPKMTLNPDRTSLEDFVFEDFTLEGYDPHPPIKAPIAV